MSARSKKTRKKVFSGRRGIHCWVADKGARFLEKDARTAVAQYCQVTIDSHAQGNFFDFFEDNSVKSRELLKTAPI